MPSHAGPKRRLPLSRSLEIERDRRWLRVTARDKRARAEFVYAVETTGIYCRPGCASRTPHPDNVRFFEDAAGAERAGFRACKRCLPNDALRTGSQIERVRLICRWIDECEREPTLSELAARMKLSPSYLQRIFKASTGLSPKMYARSKRARVVRAELGRGRTVTRAMASAGYGSSSRFYREASASLGMAPRAYRDAGARETIQFVLARSTLGWVLVGATERGVCAVSLGSNKRELERAFRARFSKAEIARGDRQMIAITRRVLAHIEKPWSFIDLPLDLQGSLFEVRVWRALREIDSGTTKSYGELARGFGSSGLARAVGRACGANPIAVLVPCHRVVGANGKLKGYRWGLDRKQELLQRERRSKGH